MQLIVEQIAALLDNFDQSDVEGMKILTAALAEDLATVITFILNDRSLDKRSVAAKLFGALRNDNKVAVFDTITAQVRAGGKTAENARELLTLVVAENYSSFASYLAHLPPVRIYPENLELLERFCTQQTTFLELIDAIWKHGDPNGLLMDIAKKHAPVHASNLTHHFIIGLNSNARRDTYVEILTELAAKNSFTYGNLRSWQDRDNFNRRHIIRHILTTVDVIHVRQERRLPPTPVLRRIEASQPRKTIPTCTVKPSRPNGGNGQVQRQKPSARPLTLGFGAVLKAALEKRQ